ncbi:RNA polymerase sigma factor [Herbaspirillum sp. alder98]|uniref:RNA polymerase sigma factor n=1 Tax=Herbaspirillum sp. alder98 TaxID=2913096 RepID=UPI001CD915B6|nr:sigma-70 family RNA polymerase sigma factor [Herbaspirillum sp. alder98]MCA1324542.1 sigma-70 family RNA polymerase sigma factor [Herbaspirillum sp. alder98]
MDLNIPHDQETSSWDEAAATFAHGAQRCTELQDFLIGNYEHLKRRLARRLGCADMVSECLHDTWLRLESHILPASVQNPEAYLYRMACNAAVDRLRCDRPWQTVAEPESELERLVDQAPGPEKIATARSELAAFERALLRLPRRHRGVLVALRIDEMSRQEVAARYGISLRTVDAALRQALDYCAEHIGQHAFAGASHHRSRSSLPKPRQ